MRIQYLNGGLANQTFQYIFARFAELYYPEGGKVYLDDSYFFHTRKHNGYELENVFGIKANLLSEYFSKDVWKEIVAKRKDGKSIVDIFNTLGIECQSICEKADIKEPIIISNDKVLVKSETFIPDIVKIEGNASYYGYWIIKDWFDAYRDIFVKEFKFPEIIDNKNKQYMKDIEESMSVAFHVRRGDYVTYNIAMDAQYYKNTVQQVLERYKDAVIFIFSDDVVWCKEHEEELGFDMPIRTVYVEGNTKEKNYIDLQLMSRCKGIILSNSAFCYLAGLLNDKKIFWKNFNKREL